MIISAYLPYGLTPNVTAFFRQAYRRDRTISILLYGTGLRASGSGGLHRDHIFCPTTATDGNSNTTSYQYDNIHRLKPATSPTATTETTNSVP